MHGLETIISMNQKAVKRVKRESNPIWSREEKIDMFGSLAAYNRVKKAFSR